ncbi:hypothetical protein SAMN05878503_102422 [Cereibacter ovatus]|uniref:Uncharacterized protein n=1 Tax=Cereibacter ovatus TaxID=439529 RepID=A0A285CN65_9RHOB|nr:hypothetical protein [Cereibacter ovatus]SNX68982.1 hypothetical protein SAMN05878503_102422 [Cereibacter ovatus]
MRRPLLLLAFLALGACRLGLGAEPETPGPAAAGLATAEIAVTPLDAPASAAPAPETARAAQPAPARPEAASAAAPESAVPKSAGQIACEKKGGSYVAVKSLYTCVRVPRDAGKACISGAECSGECLARSKTCAPYDPLVGCNDILDDFGRRMTLCLG